MHLYSDDIFTEPSNVDLDTLNKLGPLRPLAGTWRGVRGLDVKPKVDGPRKQAYVETIELQPIDPVTNGPQLFYGLRYVLIVNKPDNVKTYHEQVGYWLWEPATNTVIQTLAIPRGQIAMCWLIENEITGITIITLCTMDSVISQPGTGPPIRWWPPTWP